MNNSVSNNLKVVAINLVLNLSFFKLFVENFATHFARDTPFIHEYLQIVQFLHSSIQCNLAKNIHTRATSSYNLTTPALPSLMKAGGDVAKHCLAKAMSMDSFAQSVLERKSFFLSGVFAGAGIGGT